MFGQSWLDQHILIIQGSKSTSQTFTLLNMGFIGFHWFLQFKPILNSIWWTRWDEIHLTLYFSICCLSSTSSTSRGVWHPWIANYVDAPPSHQPSDWRRSTLSHSRSPDDIFYVSHSRSWLMLGCEKGGVMVVGQVINKTSSFFHTSRIFSLKLNNFVAWLKSRAGHLLESFWVKRYQKPPKFSIFLPHVTSYSS